MADVPRDLKDQIERLEKIFHVSTEKLKEITEHFSKELTRGIDPSKSIVQCSWPSSGLSKEGGTIVSLNDHTSRQQH